MSKTTSGLLLASKRTGDISAAKLIQETPTEWHLEVEKRKVRASKSGDDLRVFVYMSDALKWTNAEPELIAHFAAEKAASLAAENQADAPAP